MRAENVGDVDPTGLFLLPSRSCLAMPVASECIPLDGSVLGEFKTWKRLPGRDSGQVELEERESGSTEARGTALDLTLPESHHRAKAKNQLQLFP